MRNQLFITKAELCAATKQYGLGSDLDTQDIVVRYFCPWNQWEWYVMNIDPEDHDYAWGIVKGFEVEMGSFPMNELRDIRVGGLFIERDYYWRKRSARSVWEVLTNGGEKTDVKGGDLG